jgi:hypothetical protein
MRDESRALGRCPCRVPPVAGPNGQVGRSTSIEPLREAAVANTDALLESAAALRAQLRAFETTLRRAKVYFERGGSAADLHGELDITAARETLTRAAADFEAARHASRLAVFRVQQAEGMSVGAIARAWGLSRQLVSRTLKEARDATDSDAVSRRDPAQPMSAVARGRSRRGGRGSP